ncbi:MAG: ceramidase domain-containing protein [Sulfitobacter sp.]
MNMLPYIDLYCERTAPGLWNEPLNAFSNVAFLIAAFLALRIALRRGQPDPLEIGVITLGGTIGVGSFLFHIFANSATELADVIPIWSFVALYVLLIIYRSTDQNLSRTLRIGGISAFISGAVVWFTSNDITTNATTRPDILNGSLQYAPALIALVIFAALTTLRKHPARNYIVLAAVLFFASLIFRSIDLALCETTRIGTHFMWHLLNGAMVAVLLQALVLKFPPQRT